jgi:hypothetical protein
MELYIKHFIIVMAVLGLVCCRSASPPEGSDAVSGASVTGESTKQAASSFEAVKTDKRILIAFFSQGANTKRVAEELESLLGADIERIVEKTNRKGFFGFLSAGADSSMGKIGNIETPSRDPSAYDIVIVCTPVWAWKVTPPVRAYLTLMRERLPKVAFVVVAGGTAPEGIVKSMEEIAGKAALGYAGFVNEDFSAKNRSRYDQKILEFSKLFR